jgi:hypothetical protein
MIVDMDPTCTALFGQRTVVSPAQVLPFDDAGPVQLTVPRSAWRAGRRWRWTCGSAL